MAEVVPEVEFTVFDTATGKVRWTGKVRQDQVAAQAGEGQVAHEGHFDWRATTLVSGAPMEGAEPAVIIRADAVKAHAKFLLAPTDWMVIRAAEAGATVPSEIVTARALIRTRSGEIEAMDPIPADFTDPRYWD